MDRRREDNGSGPKNYFSTLVNSLRESSGKDKETCFCEEMSYTSTINPKNPAKLIFASNLCGWKSQELAPDGRHAIHSRCAPKFFRDNSTTKSRGSVRRFGIHKKSEDKFVFGHFESPSAHAEVYRRSCSSAYKNSRPADMAILQQAPLSSGCCNQWFEVVPAISKASGSNGIALDNTQQNWSKFEENTSEKDRMAFHVEWKFKSSSYGPDLYRPAYARSEHQHKRQVDHQNRVTTQLLQLMKVSHYNSDPKSDPFNSLTYGHNSKHLPTVKDVVEDAAESFCDPLSCSHGFQIPHVRPILSSVVPKNLPAPEPASQSSSVSNNVLAKVIKNSSERTIVSMQPIPVSGWRKRPPLMERRISTSAYSSLKVNGGSAAGFSSHRPQTMSTGYSIHNIQLNNAAMFKMRRPVPKNVGIPTCGVSHSVKALSGPSGPKGRLFRLSLRSNS